MVKNTRVSVKEKILKKNSLLWIGIISNVLCLLFSFHHNTWNYGDKWSLSPFHSLWEFFTIWWCVWASIILFIYNFREIIFSAKKNKSTTKNGSLSLVMNSASLTSIIGFTLMIGGKFLSEQGRLSLLKSPLSWWIYSFTWHYFVFPLSLIYFFKYSQEENFSKRKILYLIIPLPILYFLANLTRSFLADKNHFNNKPFFGKWHLVI
jgi:hypothetical protein